MGCGSIKGGLQNGCIVHSGPFFSVGLTGVWLPSCWEDTSVATDEKLRAGCTEFEIKFREFTAAGLTLRMVLGCLQSVGNRCPTPRAAMTWAWEGTTEH